MPTLQCGRCNADPITLLEMDRWPFGAANLTVQKHDVALMSLDWHQRVLRYVHLRLCQQRSQVKCGRAPMQEHACKEPMDSLAPWWDIIGAFVGEGILHQLEAFLQTMCHAGQSTRSSWN